MKIPFNGNVSERLVKKRFEGTIFYCLRDQQSGKGYKIEFGFLVDASHKCPMIKSFDKNNNINNYSQGCSWDLIFESHEEAKAELKVLKSLYLDGFDSRPFLKMSMLKSIKGDLMEVKDCISSLLKSRDDFKGVDFCDVSAGGIQVYACGLRTTLNYDMSNKISVIRYFIDNNARVES